MTEAASSSTLLVHGNEDLAATAQDPSPLSLVAARLARIAEQTASSSTTTQTLTLRYFCAENGPYTPAPQGQPLSPAGRMMASLTGQLVTHMLLLSRSAAAAAAAIEQRDLAVPLTPGQRAALETAQGLTAACTVFYALVQQLPAGTVLLCILDEVALYETGAAQRDLDAVVRRLVRLAEGCDEGVVFKLLVTCRGRAMRVGKYFAGQTLELDEDVEAEDSSSWQIASMG